MRPKWTPSALTNWLRPRPRHDSVINAWFEGFWPAVPLQSYALGICREVRNMGDEEPDLSIMITQGTVLVFRKSGTVVRVVEKGVVPDPDGDPEVIAEAQAVWNEWGHWIGIQHTLMEVGFEWIAVELFEDLAMDLLDDAVEEAANASRHLRLGEETKDSGEKLGRRLAAVPHMRRAIILGAAAGEAYVNEFIFRRIPGRWDDLQWLSPPTKWSVAVELSTKRKLEEELGDLDALKKLFSMRNQIMHFRPTTQKISFGRSIQVGKGGIVWRLQQETDPWQFPRAVTDAILALHRITREEPVDRVDEIVTRAIEKETTDYLLEWSNRIGEILDSMNPEDVEKPRQYYAPPDSEGHGDEE